MYKVSIGNAFGHSIYSDLAVAEITEGVTNAFDKIDRIFTEYHVSLLSPENMEAELFGEAVEGPSKGFVERLGAAIRSLISAFGQMIEKLGEMFMTNDAKLRKQQEQIERELAKDPDLKKKVMSLSAAGAINLKDIKDINELSKEVDKLMEEKNPKTIKGKLEKLKKEWDDPNGKFLKRIAAIGATVGLVTTIYKVSTSLRGFKDDATKGAKHTQETMQKLAEGLRNETKKYVKDNHSTLSDADKEKMVNDITDLKVNSVTAYEAKIAAKKFEHGCYQDALNILNHNYREVGKAQARVLKYLGNKGTKAVKNAPLASALNNADASAIFNPKK